MCVGQRDSINVLNVHQRGKAKKWLEDVHKKSSTFLKLKGDVIRLVVRKGPLEKGRTEK